MSSNLETNAASSQVVISRQLSEYVSEHYGQDQELVGMVEDMGEAARRLYGWLRFLQGIQQKVKVTYSQFLATYFRERE